MYGDLQKGIDAMVRTVREESIAGIRVIKALSKVEQEKEHFAQGQPLRWSAATPGPRCHPWRITNPMMNLLLNVGADAGHLWWAPSASTAASTQPGVIIAFLSYFTIILNAMLTDDPNVRHVLHAPVHRPGRIQEVLETPPRIWNLTDEPEEK